MYRNVMLFRLQPEGATSLTAHTHVTHSIQETLDNVVGATLPQVTALDAPFGDNRITHTSLNFRSGGSILGPQAFHASSDTDQTPAQRSWPSFGFQARCG